MNLREIEPHDIPALFAVRVATRQNALSLDELTSLGITEESVLATLGATHRGWLCEEDGRVVGFAMGNRENGEMWVIALLPEFEGRGIGAALMARVEEWLWSEGWSEIWLTTDTDPALRAYGFYRRLGWADHEIKDGLRYMKKARPSGGVPNRAGPPPFEAALLIPVPEAETLAAEYRKQYDRSAPLGMPAHITINYPFQPHVTRPREAEPLLRALFASFQPFTFALSEIRTFPGVLYLAPHPPDPFLALIDAVASRFPDSPPYGGLYGESIPHLTVAQVDGAALPPIQERLTAAAAPLLPLTSRAEEVWLMDNFETLWRKRFAFQLGQGRA
jgi:GNAT superfamily N-acetyltransferase/2'-5' RNA ligase